MNLAINGGQKSVTSEAKEMWKPPYEIITSSISKMIYDGRLSGDWEHTYFPFEREIANYFGAKYCAALNCGTSALWSAYIAIGIKPGDEVLCPTYTWISTIAPALFMGAAPILCDTEADTVLVDPEDVKKKITNKTKAIVVTHMYGNIVNMDAIMDISNKLGIPVIEDCSHAHGAEWRGKKIGTIGHVGCFSMQGGYNGKPVPAGEGGFVLTNDRDIFNKIIMYTHINRSNNPEDELYPEIIERYGAERFGMKFRAHPFSLVIAREMLKSLDYRNEQKSKYRNKIISTIGNMKGIKPFKQYEQAKTAGYFGGMQLLYDEKHLLGIPLYKIHKAIAAEGVSLSYRNYKPLHLYQFLQDGHDLPGINMGIASQNYKGYTRNDFPTTNHIIEHLIGMPVFIEETEGYSDQVINAFEKVLSNLNEIK